MKLSKKLQDKVDIGKARNPDYFDHIDNNDVVKRQGTELRNYVDSEKDEVVMLNGQKVTIKRQVLLPTTEYAELEIEMVDSLGNVSSHVTPVSATRKAQGFSLDELTDLYMSDLEQWAKEGADDTFLDRAGDRTPVKVVK